MATLLTWSDKVRPLSMSTPRSLTETLSNMAIIVEIFYLYRRDHETRGHCLFIHAKKGDTIIPVYNWHTHSKACCNVIYSCWPAATKLRRLALCGLSPKFSRKLLPLICSLTYCLTSSSFQSAYRMFYSTETTLLGTLLSDGSWWGNCHFS